MSTKLDAMLKEYERSGCVVGPDGVVVDTHGNVVGHLPQGTIIPTKGKDENQKQRQDRSNEEGPWWSYWKG